MVYVEPVIEETLPAIEIFLPDSVVESLSIDQAFPQAGTPAELLLPIHPQDTYLRQGWDAVYNYITDAFDPGPAPAQLNMTNVILAFQAPIERQVQALGTYINLLQEFVTKGGAATMRNDLRLRNAVDTVEQITHSTDERQGARLAAIELLAIPSLQAQITNARGFAYQLALATVKAMQVWTTEHIFIPLATATATERITREAQIKKITQTDIPDLRSELLAKLAPVAAAAAAASTIAAKVATWVDDCGAPMCETMGPKTDLGKLLKGLKLASTLALLAELAALDENGIEQLLRGLQSLSKGVISEFDQLFVGGGETLGQTITGAGG